MRRTIDYLRLWSLVLSIGTIMATQSRALFGGLGFGEVAGFLFVVVTAANTGRGLSLVAKIGLGLFPVGFIVGAGINSVAQVSRQSAPSDLLAIAFSLLFAMCTVAWLRSRPRPASFLANALTLAVLVQAIPLFLLAFDIFLPAWLTDSEEPGVPFLSRYIGLSDNPNQLGLLLCAYPFVVLTGIGRTKSDIERIFLALGLIVGIVLAGVARSNTVFAAYIVGGSLWTVLWLNRWHQAGRRGLSLGRLVLTVVLGLVSVVAFVGYTATSIDKTGDSDANGRFQRWNSAIDGIAQSSLLGVGPGGQSGETGPFQGEEAHNLWLDVALQGGSISLLAYVLIVVASLRRAISCRSLLGLCVVVAILTQQSAHYTARQPLSWIYLLLPFTLANQRQRRDIQRPNLIVAKHQIPRTRPMLAVSDSND